MSLVLDKWESLIILMFHVKFDSNPVMMRYGGSIVSSETPVVFSV